MKCFTYYADVPGLWPADTQYALIDVWRRSWRKAGWEPIVLTEADVRGHPRFHFFDEQFAAKPTTYGVPYTKACFLRWLAAAHAGGGLLLDYDVMAYNFPPHEPDPSKMVIYCDSPSIFMGAVNGVSQHFLDMCEIFAAWNPDQHDFNHSAGQHHLDDLSLLVRFFDAKTYGKPEWLVKEAGCSLWDALSCRTSPMVHYGYRMKETGHWPKHEWIERIRPF